MLGLGVSDDKIFKYPFSSIHKDEILSEPVSKDEKLELRKKLGMTEEKIILSVGRFTYNGGYGKGFDLLIKSAASFEKNIGFYIVGDEPTQEFVDLVKELNVENVHFIGFKTKTELSEYYMASDLFVLMTRGDVWGLVINEAMSKGLPVITTDKCIAGLEMISSEYLIFDLDNFDSIVFKLSELIGDDTLMNIISKQNLQICSKYTIELMAESHIAILNQLGEN